MDCERKPSRFLRIIGDGDNVVAIFHQLHPNPLYLKTAAWEKVAHDLGGDSSLHDELVRRKLLITGESDDADELLKYRAVVIKRLNRPGILYLMLAQGCNNKCSYCPIPTLAEKYGASLLTLEDAIAGVELWREHIKGWNDDEPYYIIFYGGEPLLNREVFELLVSYIAQKRADGDLPDNLELILSTNGRLIDSSLATLLAKNDILVVLGIDGAPAYNNLTRITIDGQATSSAVESAALLLREHGVQLSASVSLTPQNVRVADEHKKYLAEHGITHIGFNLLKGAALRSSLGSMKFEEYYRLAAQVVVDGYADDRTQEYQLQKKLSALEQSHPFGDDCPCYGSQIVVQADGMVTNCPFLRTDMGHVRSLPNTFRIWETQTVQLWRSRIPLLCGDDESSDATFLDGGGCAWGSEELFGSPTARDQGNEIFNQEITHALIWKKLPRETRRQLVGGQITHWSDWRVRTL